MPGMAVDIVTRMANLVGPGAVGELVIRKPWIGMARGFSRTESVTSKPTGRGAQKSGYTAIGRGDEDGHWYILGRQDDTLKIAGKR